jgi:hypothetical protein
MDEQRKIDRRFLLYYMRIYNAANLQQIGNLVDITPAGIMVVSDHPLPEGQTTRLRVEVTEEVSDKPFMEFSALSKWCEPDIIPHMYNTGFEILDLTPEDSDIILHIIEKFGFRDNKPKN